MKYLTLSRCLIRLSVHTELYNAGDFIQGKRSKRKESTRTGFGSGSMEKSASQRDIYPLIPACFTKTLVNTK